jgi:hypothetical protein
MKIPAQERAFMSMWLSGTNTVLIQHADARPLVNARQRHDGGG